MKPKCSILTLLAIACVLAIDGKLVPDASARSGEEIPVTPGRHEVAIILTTEPGLAGRIPGQHTGDIFPGRPTGIGRDFVFDALPGASYEILYVKPESWGATWRNPALFTTDPDILLRDRHSGADVPIDFAATKAFVLLNGRRRPSPSPNAIPGAASEKPQGGRGASTPPARGGASALDQLTR